MKVNSLIGSVKGVAVLSKVCLIMGTAIAAQISMSAAGISRSVNMGAWSDDQIRSAHNRIDHLSRRVQSVEEQLEVIRNTLDEAKPANAWILIGQLKEKLNHIYYEAMSEL
jgi:predicted RNase H-like nuclease (RuvC/YqgF family)